MSATFPSSTVYTQVLCDSILHVAIPFSSSKGTTQTWCKSFLLLLLIKCLIVLKKQTLANLLTAITAKAYYGALLSRDSNAQVGMSLFNATNMISSPQYLRLWSCFSFQLPKGIKTLREPKANRRSTRVSQARLWFTSSKCLAVFAATAHEWSKLCLYTNNGGKLSIQAQENSDIRGISKCAGICSYSFIRHNAASKRVPSKLAAPKPTEHSQELFSVCVSMWSHVCIPR